MADVMKPESVPGFMSSAINKLSKDADGLSMLPDKWLKAATKRHKGTWFMDGCNEYQKCQLDASL